MLLSFEETEEVYRLIDYYEFKVLKTLFPTLKVSERMKQYEKTTSYKPKYLSESPKNAKFQKTLTYTNSTDDNKAILKLLKLVHEMLNTNDYSYVQYDKETLTLEIGKIDNNKQKYDIQIKESKSGKTVGKIQTSELR